MPGRVVVPKILEYIEYPWARGLATANGVRYATGVNANADAVWAGDTTNKTLNVMPLDYPGGQGTLKEVDFGITVAFKTDNGDSLLTWKVQAKDVNTSSPKAAVSWVDVSDACAQNRPFNTVFYDNTISGRALMQSNFNSFPFEMRFLFQNNTAGITEAKIKNSSWVRYLYVID